MPDNDSSHPERAAGDREQYRGQRLIDQNSPVVLDLLQHLGHTLWAVQLLEEGVAHYLVMVHQLPVGTAQDEAEAAFETAEKHTLGALLSRIRGHGAPQALVDELKKFVEERNWVVHRIHREYWGSARNPETSSSLVQRLDGIADDALRIANLFIAEVEKRLLDHGVSRELLEKTAIEIASDARAGASTAGRRGFGPPKD